jgi:fatty-acyl-CoA synthase
MTSIRARSRALYSKPKSVDDESSRLQRYISALQVNPGRGSADLMPTPTRNSGLPFRRGGFRSLCEALDYAAHGETGLNFFDARGRMIGRLPYADLRTRAQRFARCLIGAGIARGERLVIVADTWPGFCVAFFGAQYAGVLPVPVAVPVGLGAKQSYIRQLRRQILAAGAIAVVAPDDLAEFAVTAAEGTWARFAGPMSLFEAMPEAAGELRPFGAGDRCYIQYSSGSTREPLGVDIRQDQLMANIDGSIARQQLDADDSGVSWLPLYHDMGLIGFVLAPMCAQRSVDLLAPRDFARRPMQWLSLISRRRATVTYSPTFGYDLVARRARQQLPEGIDLSCLKLAGIGADMIQPAVLRRFADAFAICGFDSRAFMPSYGMAEVCVGLSFGRRFTGFRTDLRDGREFVSCGQTMDGHRLQIRGDSGFALGEGSIGRIFAEGPSVMPGYFLKTEETAQVLKDGWLDTGDLGYWRDGELVVTGRAKDLIIVNGRNIWPQDIEWAVEGLPRLRRGDACAFSVSAEEREEVVVLVQGEPPDAADQDELVARVHQVVRESAAVDCRVVLIARRPGLPLTSSGKLSRIRARANYLAGLGAGLADGQ